MPQSIELDQHTDLVEVNQAIICSFSKGKFEGKFSYACGSGDQGHYGTIVSNKNDQ